MARDLGIYLHASKERVAWILTTRFDDQETLKNGKYCLQGLLVSTDWPDLESWLAVPEEVVGTRRPFGRYGRASILFPSLKGSGGHKNDLWCKVCIESYGEESIGIRRGGLTSLRGLADPGCLTPWYSSGLRELTTRCRLVVQFLDQQCFDV